jgi:ubiquitin-like protein 4
MNELSFARQFLAALDSRPVKLSSDHVADPRGYPAQGAVCTWLDSRRLHALTLSVQYTLPKPSNQSAKRKREPAATAPGAEKAGSSLTVSLKNLKSPSSSIQLEAQALTTSIYDLKSAYASKSGGAVDKIKLLYNKKPTSDSKTLKDILGDTAETAKDVEFSVMVMGGGAASGAKPSPVASPGIEIPQPDLAPAPVAQGPGDSEVLKSAAFWEDLKGFLQQRLKDESEAARLTSLFKNSWEKSS